jgi:predicted metallopeptidase
MYRRRPQKPVVWGKADDVKRDLVELVNEVQMDWVDLKRVYCVRSTNSTARAYARIWGMGRLWQETLGIPAVYCIEVISEKFDPLPKQKQIEVLFHELAHIPKNFSGALLPHTRHHKGSFHDKLKNFLNAYKKR